MYCGSNKTARSSQDRIACALIALMEQRPFSAISVSELSRAAGVSRQTFYSLFGTKEDVISYVLRESYGYSMDAAELPGCDSALERMCRGYSGYIASQRQFLRLLVENNISYLLYDSIAGSLLECGCFLGARPPRERQYAANFTAGGIAGIVREYVMEEGEGDALDQIFLELFSGSIYDEP